MKRKVSVLILLTALLAAKTGWDHRMETAYPHPFPDITSLLFFPKGPALQFATAGFRQWTADFLYLWAIQYYGHYEVKERYEYIRHIFNLITDLDPRYVDAYRLAALICVIEIHDLEHCGLYFLDRGLKNNPEAWELAVDAAYYCQYYKHDQTCLSAYLERARAMPDAPQFIIRWMAKLQALRGDLDTALAMWRELLQKGHAYTRRVAQIHIHDLLIIKQARELRSWVLAVRERTGRYPARLHDLRRYGYTGPLLDSEGRPFRYDPQTGRVLPDERSLYTYGRILHQMRM